MSAAALPPLALPVARPRPGGRVLLPRLVAGIIILALWEGLVRGFAPDYVAKPSSIVAAIPMVLGSTAFLRSAGITLWAVVEGLAIALVLGTAIGLWIGRSRIADSMLRHYINAFYAMPMIVVLPLLSLWFGYTGAARLATIVFAAVFSIITNVADGAQAVPGEYLETARSFRAPQGSILGEIVLPAATPYLLAGLRLAAGRALIGAVVAEFFTAIDGLGYFILYNSRSFHHDRAFVAVLLLAAFGVGVDRLIDGGTRRFLPWYRRDEAVE